MTSSPSVKVAVVNEPLHEMEKMDHSRLIAVHIDVPQWHKPIVTSKGLVRNSFTFTQLVFSLYMHFNNLSIWFGMPIFWSFFHNKSRLTLSYALRKPTKHAKVDFLACFLCSTTLAKMCSNSFCWT